MKSTNNKTSTRQSPRRRLKREALLLLTTILLAGNVFWFFMWLLPNKEKPQAEEVVATIQKDSITREQWLVAMEQEIGRETLLALVNDRVMEAAAKKYKIEVTNEEIDLELALMHAADNQTVTDAEKTTERNKIRTHLILEKVLTKDVVIDEKELKKNFKENAALYDMATSYQTALIVLPTGEAAEQTVKELANGSDFQTLARERSIDPVTARLGGALGYIHKETETVDPAVLQVVTSMKENTISPVIALQDGTFAIAQVDHIIKGRKFKFNEVADYIQRNMALEQLPESVNPEAFWKEFNVSWFYGE